MIHCGVVFASPLGDTFTGIFCIAAWRYDLGYFLSRRLVIELEQHATWIKCGKDALIRWFGTEASKNLVF